MTARTELDDPAAVVRIFLLDDHEVVRYALAAMLSATPGFEVVGEASTVRESLDRALACRPDVALLDVLLPDGSGVDACRDIRSALPATRCLMLTSEDDQSAVLSAVLAGASGYLPKEVRAAGLIEAIRDVARGKLLIDPTTIAQAMDRVRETARTADPVSVLSPRERQVLDHIADGLTNRQIGERMYLAEKTVKNYVSSLLGKLGMQRRTQAAVLGAQVREVRREAT